MRTIQEANDPCRAVNHTEASIERLVNMVRIRTINVADDGVDEKAIALKGIQQHTP